MVTLTPNRWYRLTVVVALAGLLLATATTADASVAQRIVVLGEVQGAAETTASLLQHLELIDEGGHWIGGETTLIQMGDLVDGGEHVRAALDLFMRLQPEAEAAGGRVIVLLGNHEAMNILRELKSVNYMAYESFADADSVDRQQRLFDTHVACMERRAKVTGSGRFEYDDEYREVFFATHPLGWVEYVEAMRPEGRYGKWLRSLPAAVRVGDLLFVHGGIGPEYRGMTIEAINQQIADEIVAFDEDSALMVAGGLSLPTDSLTDMSSAAACEIESVKSMSKNRRKRGDPRIQRLMQLRGLNNTKSWAMLSAEGPLWFQGAREWPDNHRGAEMAAILEDVGVRRMITGQGLGSDRVIGARFDGRVLLTSVDLVDGQWGGGTPAALEIDNDVYTIVTLSSREVLIDDRSSD